MHPKYDNSNFDNDFCILKIFGRLLFSATRKAVSLPDEDDFTKVGEFVKVLGWGNTQNPLESTDYLRGVELIVIDDLECEKMYEIYNIDVQSNKVCAVHPDRIDGKDACQGDSGDFFLLIFKVNNSTKIFQEVHSSESVMENSSE
jgi:secreted trypsin-like serine protease